jgi:hypothetical protein
MTILCSLAVLEKPAELFCVNRVLCGEWPEVKCAMDHACC